MRTVLCLALILGSASMLRAAEPEPQPVPRDEQDLIFFQTSRPLLLRLHLQVEGKSFRANWDQLMAQLFRFLDYDGNGRLSAREAEHAPSVAQLRSMIQGKAEIEADAPPTYADLTDDPNAGVTVEQLTGYYHRVGVAPWQIDGVGRNNLPDHLDDELLKELNPDNPGQLPRTAFTRWPILMRRFDANVDELITAVELSRIGYAGGFRNPTPFKANEGQFYVLDPSDKGHALLAVALIKRYDTTGDGKLAPTEIAFDAAVFQALDRNGDGLLVADELVNWPQSTPDLAVVLRLDGAPATSIRILPHQAHRPLVAKLARIGAVQLELPDERIEIMCMDGSQQKRDQMQQKALSDFGQFDKNQDGVLDSREIQVPPFELVAILRLGDRDGDEKLSRDEFRQWLELQKKVVTRNVIITLIERGRCLFDFLDGDHDHRLSRRELLSGGEGLAPWSDRQRGVIERGKIPQQFQIIVSQGQLAPFDSDVGAVGAGRPEKRLAGPIWFRKMDRNADGDLSPVEFLGTAEQFRKLDFDGDGLIGLAEAEAAGSAIDKAARPRK